MLIMPKVFVKGSTETQKTSLTIEKEDTTATCV